jgi:hypothetical protein
MFSNTIVRALFTFLSPALLENSRKEGICRILTHALDIVIIKILFMNAWRLALVLLTDDWPEDCMKRFQAHERFSFECLTI